MRVFLTGATGYIGGAVLKALQARGHEVVALVRDEGKTRHMRAGGAIPVLGDMREPDAWKAEAALCDAIVHAAQIRFSKRIGRSWVRQAMQADAAAVRGLLAAAHGGGRCKAFVYTSGVSVFGNHGDAWIDETVAVKPSAMGSFHMAGERLVAAIARDVPTVILRPGLPYAAGGTFASHFLAEAATGKFRFVGSGENFCASQHLDDLAEAYALAVEAPPAGQTIAIVDDEPLRMKEIGALLLAEFGGGNAQGVPKWLVALFAGQPLAEMLTESYRVKNGRAKELLGWKPRHPGLRSTLPEIAAEYRRQQAAGESA